MKKNTLLFSLVFLLALLFVTCKKQEYSLQQAITDQKSLTSTADSLRRLSGVIHYTINIVDGGDAVFTPGWWNYYGGGKGGNSIGSLTSVKNARVTASQYGKTFVVYADSVGI